MVLRSLWIIYDEQFGHFQLEQHQLEFTYK